MANKINDTSTYPNTAPALGDHFVGTDVSDTGKSADGEIVTFTFQAAMDLFEASMAAPTTIISSGTFANARISAGSVTQHQAALSITESQISDFGTYQPLDPFLTDIANLTDPGADRLPFWDDSAGDIVWLTPGTGLSITGTTMSVSGPTSIIASGTFANARIAETNVTQHEAALSITESQISDLGGYLLPDTTDNLTVGYTTTSNDIGTVTTGTTTLAFANGQVQRLVNGGAFTLAPPSSGEGTMVLQVTNNASAGTIITSGFTSVTGDTFDTTNANVFLCSIARINGVSWLQISAASGNA